MIKQIVDFVSPSFTMIVVGLFLAQEVAKEPTAVTASYWGNPSSVSILVAAVFVGLVNMYTARTARLVAISETHKAVAPIAAKVNEMSPVVNKIEAHVNSEKTRDQGIIASQNQQINLMRETIDEMRKERALLAQARVVAEAVTGTAAAATAGATTPIKTDRRKEDQQKQSQPPTE